MDIIVPWDQVGVRGGAAVKKNTGAMEKMEKQRSERHTLPLLYSTHAAFFFASVTKAPAIVVVIVSGGVC